MSKDIKLYVKNCQRSVVRKTPEPDACAPLESVWTSEPMELVCIDFWCAEKNFREGCRCFMTDHFSKMAPCHNRSVAFGMISFAFMDFQKEYIQNRM